MSKKNEDKNKRSGIIEAVFSVIFLLLVVYIIDWGFLKNEITSYEIICPDDYDGCYNLRYSRYKISEERQEVIHWVEGFSPETIKNCSIVNRKNWTCEWSDGSAEFGFNRGSYFKHILSDSVTTILEDRIHSVSRFTYLLYYWGIK